MKEKIPILRNAFKKDGTITAGNASKINDAGCALRNYFNLSKLKISRSCMFRR